jgi:RNA-directed DNA polymerase
LANLYMNWFLKYWRRSGKGDLVILSREHAEEALEWAGEVMTKIGLTLNEVKTSVRDASRETFNFLGYTLGPQRYWKDGRRSRVRSARGRTSAMP